MGSFLAVPDLQPVLLPVHSNSRGLLVHECQGGAQQSWDECSQHCPPRAGLCGVDEPPTAHTSAVSFQPSHFAGFDPPLRPCVSPSPGFMSPFPWGSAVPPGAETGFFLWQLLI